MEVSVGDTCHMESMPDDIHSCSSYSGKHRMPSKLSAVVDTFDSCWDTASTGNNQSVALA